MEVDIRAGNFACRFDRCAGNSGPFQYLEALQGAPLEELTRVPNTGEVVGTSIRDWFQDPDNIALVKALKEHGLNFGEADGDEAQSKPCVELPGSSPEP